MYSFAAVSKVLPEARCSSFSVAHAAASASHFLLPLGDGSSQVKDLYIRFPDGSLCENTRQRQDPDGSFFAVAIFLPLFLIVWHSEKCYNQNDFTNRILFWPLVLRQQGGRFFIIRNRSGLSSRGPFQTLCARHP